MSNENNFIIKRKHKRVLLGSFIKLQGKQVLLTDISQSGLKVAVTSIPFHKNLDIQLDLSAGKFDLYGRVVWTNRRRSYSGLIDVGIFLPNPPDLFIEAVRSLERDN